MAHNNDIIFLSFQNEVHLYFNLQNEYQMKSVKRLGYESKSDMLLNLDVAGMYCCGGKEQGPMTSLTDTS